MPGSSILVFFLVCAVFTYFKEVVYHDQAFLDFFFSAVFTYFKEVLYLDQVFWEFFSSMLFSLNLKKS